MTQPKVDTSDEGLRQIDCLIKEHVAQRQAWEAERAELVEALRDAHALLELRCGNTDITAAPALNANRALLARYDATGKADP